MLVNVKSLQYLQKRPKRWPTQLQRNQYSVVCGNFPVMCAKVVMLHMNKVGSLVICVNNGADYEIYVVLLLQIHDLTHRIKILISCWKLLFFKFPSFLYNIYVHCLYGSVSKQTGIFLCQDFILFSFCPFVSCDFGFFVGGWWFISNVRIFVIF